MAINSFVIFQDLLDCKIPDHYDACYMLIHTRYRSLKVKKKYGPKKGKKSMKNSQQQQLLSNRHNYPTQRASLDKCATRVKKSSVCNSLHNQLL